MSFNPPLQASFIRGQNSLSIIGGHWQQNVNCSSESEPGLSILRQAASLSAGHDASDRDPPPRCAQGTREKVIKDIMDWITDPSPRKSVMWLSGPFGNGKSAVMQTIADRLRDDTNSNHLLAASFFFGRGKSQRDQAKYLIPTIAYQIAIAIPDMRQAVNNALIQDPTILSKSIDAQLQCLITKPLHKVAFAPFRTTPTVLIDGLDECEGPNFQRLILKAIFSAVMNEHIRLRFLIASRPEPQISETFRMVRPLDRHHYSITLVDDYQTREELRQFLQSGFDEMYQRRFDLVSMVRRPWPSEEDLSDLVDRASGQFLYASTVLRFVDSDMVPPTRQLTLILQRQPSNAFSNMDELYTQILESCPCQEILPSFLHSLLAERLLKIDRKYSRLTIADHSVVSGLHPDDFSIILRWFPAIVNVDWPPSPPDLPPDDWPHGIIIQLYSPKLSVHHQSFIEFLTDHRRSGRFHVNLDTAYQKMKASLDALLAESLSKGEQSQRIHRSTWNVIHSMLRRDFFADRRLNMFGWPHLEKTLNDFKEGRTPPLSKPCPEFLDALRHILDSFLHCNFEDHCIRHYITVLTDLHDRSFLLTISPNSEVWKIAGALALVPVSHLEDFQSLEPAWIQSGPSHCMDGLPQLTGLPLTRIFQLLEENWNFIDAEISSYPDPEYCCFFVDMQHHEAFLKDEVRSGDLYVTYRNSAVDALEFGIKMLKSVRELDMFGVIFISFCTHGWDIRIDEDLRKGSAMDKVINLLLHNDPVVPKRLTGNSTFPDAAGASYLSLQWLIKQLHNLDVVPNPNHTITIMIQHLRDIIDRSKEDAIILSFDGRRQTYQSKSELRPYCEVIEYIAVEDGSWDEVASLTRKFYSDISFLLSGISAECHGSILGYHLHVLISWIYYEECVLPDQTLLLYQFESQLDGVQWEYHLSRANASKMIHDQLLTIHYFLPLEEYDDETQALSCLPTPLVRGGLEWFRKHYEPNESFDTWCEEVIAMRAEVCPSATLSKSLVHDTPQSASISPFHDQATTTVADIDLT